MQGGERNRPGGSSPDAGFREVFPSIEKASMGKNFRKAPLPLRARSGSVRGLSVRRRARGVRREGAALPERWGVLLRAGRVADPCGGVRDGGL